MARREETVVPPLLDVNEVARRLGTEPRFVRRLIAERRIEFHKLGRHVRISESALAEFVKAGRVEPMRLSESQHRMRGVA
jgi:excisionase family DNA binding protein